MVTVYGCALNGERHAAWRVRELDCVRKYVDEHLFELGVVADVIVADAADHRALVVKPLFAALGHDHGVQLLQHGAEGKLLFADRESPGFDSAHVQDIVDQPQEMPGASAYFLQVFPRFARKRIAAQRQAVQSDDRVHGRADLVAHVRQESRLGLVGFFRCGKRFAERLVLGHCLAHFGVDDRKAEANRVHDMVLAVLHVAHAGHPDHLVVLAAIAFCQVAICDDGLVHQGFAHAVWVDEL